ncbi:MAG: zinc ribbon domain-containing protein, partial [Ruminococcus sp.]|nr:zinc ribbon domain-containing protein [Ruminococcus sp.]
QKKKVHRYYKCVSVKRHKGCDKKTIKKEWIENIVIEQIKKVVFDDKLIESLADTVLEIQGAENTTLPLLRKQYAEILKGIDNMLNAIQQGIITSSTKERLEELEHQKSELAVQITKEEMCRPTLTKEQIIFWVERFRKLNTNKLEHRRRLIDSFINSIYLYDDRIVITFNYKDGSKTITLEEIENSALGSDLTSLAAPKRESRIFYSLFLISYISFQVISPPYCCIISFVQVVLPFG